MDVEEIINALKQDVATTLGITPDDPEYDILMDI